MMFIYMCILWHDTLFIALIILYTRKFLSCQHSKDIARCILTITTNRIMYINYNHLFCFSKVRLVLEMTPWLCVYVPPANLEGAPRAALLDLGTGR